MFPIVSSEECCTGTMFSEDSVPRSAVVAANCVPLAVVRAATHGASVGRIDHPYGDGDRHRKTMDPNTPAGEIKTAWESAKEAAGVQCRFHDLRHTACTRLLERGASLPIVASILGWSASTTAKMVKRYGHIGSDVQRTALEALDRSPRPSKQTQDSERDRPSDSQPNS